MLTLSMRATTASAARLGASRPRTAARPALPVRKAVSIRGPAPPAASLSLGADEQKALLVAGFAATVIKGVALNVDNVMKGFALLIAVATAAKAALGVDGAVGETGSFVAPAAFALQQLQGVCACLPDVGTGIVTLYSFLTAKGLGLPTAQTLGVLAVLGAAVYKGLASEFLTAAIAARSVQALVAGGGKIDKSAAVDAAVVAAAGYAAYKSLYGPFVTVGALHATAMSALGLVGKVVEKLGA